MGEHTECVGCERTVLEDELCEECGLCTRCCECELAGFDADELGLDPEDEFLEG